MYTAIEKYEISKIITLIKTIMTRSKLYKAKKGWWEGFFKDDEYTERAPILGWVAIR